MKLAYVLLIVFTLAGGYVIGLMDGSQWTQEATASPLDHPVLENWQALYFQYDRMQNPNEPPCMNTLGQAIDHFVLSIDIDDPEYVIQHPRTVQMHAVKLMWQVQRFTELYANRWYEDE